MYVRQCITPGLEEMSPVRTLRAHVDNRSNAGQYAFVILQARMIFRYTSGVHGGVGIAKQYRVITLQAQLQCPVGKTFVQWCAVWTSQTFLDTY